MRSGRIKPTVLAREAVPGTCLTPRLQPGRGRPSLRARPHGPPGRTGGADGAPHGCVRTVADGFVGHAAVLEPRRPEQLLTHDVADVLGVGA